jgi:hypothetical protein
MTNRNFTAVTAQIDVQIGFLVRCRSVFPRLGRHLVGERVFKAPEYYRQHGHNVVVELPEPMTPDFINGLNSLAHWLNESFVLRLFAVLESHALFTKGIRHDLDGHDEMDITRRLRNMIGHGGLYDPTDSAKKKLYDRIVQYFQVDPGVTLMSQQSIRWV